MKKSCPSPYVVEVELQGSKNMPIYFCGSLEAAEELMNDFSNAIREARGKSYYWFFNARNFSTDWPTPTGSRKTLYNPDSIIRVALEGHDQYLKNNTHVLCSGCAEGID